MADAFAAGDRAGTAAAITDEFIDEITILGTPEQCRERLAAFVEAGVTTPVIAPLAGSREGVLQIVEALAPSR